MFHLGSKSTTLDFCDHCVIGKQCRLKFDISYTEVEAQLIRLTLIFGLPPMFHVKVVPWLRRVSYHIKVRHVKLPNNMKTLCKTIFNKKERIPRVEDARHQTTVVAKSIDRENILTWMKLSFLLWSIFFDLLSVHRA